MPRTLLPVLPALLMVSCTGVPAGWHEATRSTHPVGVEGAWTGTWRSEGNGHSGGLRAVATAVPGNKDVRHFHFRASWAKVLRAGFTFDARVRKTGPDTWTVEGARDLGRVFGGTFTCSGTVHGDDFKARYDAKMDHGVMELRRVKAAP